MPDNFQFTLIDRTGKPIQVIQNLISATWIRTTNRLGSCRLEVNPKNFDFGLITQPDVGLLIESGTPLTPDLETFWFLRGFRESRTNKQELLALDFEDSMSLLKRRLVSLRADIPEGSEPRTRLNGPANVEMNRLFSEITSIPSFSRDWSGNVSVAPIAVPAPLIQKEVPWRNLLQTMQQIARTSRDKGTPLFFDVLARNNYTFEFTTYLGQRGQFHEGLIYTDNPAFKLESFAVDYNVANTGYVAGGGRGQNRLLGFAQDEVDGVFGIFEAFKSLNVSNQEVLNDEASELVNGASGKVALSGQLLGHLADEFDWGDRLVVSHRTFDVECEIATIRTTLIDEVTTRDIVVRSI